MRFGKVHLGLGECVRNFVEFVVLVVIPKALLEFRHRLLYIGDSRSWSPDCHRSRPLRHRCGNFLRVPKLPRRSLWL